MGAAQAKPNDAPVYKPYLLEGENNLIHPIDRDARDAVILKDYSDAYRASNARASLSSEAAAGAADTSGASETAADRFVIIEDIRKMVEDVAKFYNLCHRDEVAFGAAVLAVASERRSK